MSALGMPSRKTHNWFLAVGAVIIDQSLKAAILAADTLPATLTASWHPRGPAAAVISALIVAGLLAAVAISPRTRRAGVYLMIGGGMSNLLDYLRAGAVLNIIKIGSLQLNIADILVVIGAVWLLTERKT